MSLFDTSWSYITKKYYPSSGRQKFLSGPKWNPIGRLHIDIDINIDMDIEIKIRTLVILPIKVTRDFKNIIRLLKWWHSNL